MNNDQLQDSEFVHSYEYERSPSGNTKRWKSRRIKKDISQLCTELYTSQLGVCEMDPVRKYKFGCFNDLFAWEEEYSVLITNPEGKDSIFPFHKDLNSALTFYKTVEENFEKYKKEVDEKLKDSDLLTFYLGGIGLGVKISKLHLRGEEK